MSDILSRNSENNNIDEWELPKLLRQIQKELIRRNALLLGNSDPNIQKIVQSNMEMMSHLQECLVAAERSQKLIETFFSK